MLNCPSIIVFLVDEAGSVADVGRVGTAARSDAFIERLGGAEGMIAYGDKAGLGRHIAQETREQGRRLYRI